MLVVTRLRCVPVTLGNYCAGFSTASVVTPGGKIKIPLSSTMRDEGHWVKAKIGDTANCRKAISEAIAKRAFEIYQHQGCRPGQDRYNWRVAESELVQPLPCGLLVSNDEITISVFSSVFIAKDIDEIEACVEPHSLILAGKKGSVSGEDVGAVRILPLKDEFDPTSAKLRQKGPYLEIEIHKSQANK
jgi:hypothetical protein